MASIKSTIGGLKHIIFPEMQELSLRAQFDISDIAMIVFFSERLFTYIFSIKMGGLGAALLIAILGLLYIMALAQRIVQKEYSALFLFTSVALAIVSIASISILCFPELKFWFFGSEWSLLIKMLDLRNAISGLLLVLLVKKPQKILRNICISAFLYFLYLCYQTYLFVINSGWSSYYTLAVGSSRYNMSYGYKMIFVFVVFITIAFVKRSFLLIALSATAFCLALSYGSRGVLLTTLAFGIIFVLFIVQQTWRITRSSIIAKMKALSLILLVLIGGFLLVKTMPLVEKTIHSALVPIESSNASLPDEEIVIDDASGTREEDDSSLSRTVDAILEGDIWADNGRFMIWKTAYDGFLERPLTGSGLFGDRLYVGKEFRTGYTHNIILELLVQFGIWGFAFLAVLILFVVKIWLKNDDMYTSLLVVIMTSMCAVLLVSDSYLFNTFFWSLLGLMLVYYNVYELICLKRKIIVTVLLVVGIVTTALFVLQDFRSQSFKTIIFNEPTVLLATVNSKEGLHSLHGIVESYDVFATAFINGSSIEESDSDDFEIQKQNVKKMGTEGWAFEDGGYYLRNPYGRSSKQQDADYEKTVNLFRHLCLPLPVCYSPPRGPNNSAMKYRTMYTYDFIQSKVTSNNASPKKLITYPDTLNMDAIRILWHTEAEEQSLFRYLERAKQERALSILYIDSEDYSDCQFKKVLQFLIDNEFEFITYRNLQHRAYDHQEKLGWKNYFENMYITGRIVRLLKYG